MDPQQQPAIQQPLPEQPTQQPAPVYPAGPQQTSSPDPGKGLGIAALVTGILGLSLIAIILGIIGLNKSKKAGQHNTPAVVGIVFGVIWLILTVILNVAIFSSAFSATKDAANSASQRIDTTNRTNALHAKLEEYYNENASYPRQISSLSIVKVDPSYLNDPVSGEVTSPSTTPLDEDGAEQVVEPTVVGQVQYIPFDCENDGCSGYVLRANVGTDSVVYTKYGLQNP
jgi:hypothetical protein